MRGRGEGEGFIIVRVIPVEKVDDSGKRDPTRSSSIARLISIRMD